MPVLVLHRLFQRHPCFERRRQVRDRPAQPPARQFCPEGGEPLGQRQTRRVNEAIWLDSSPASAPVKRPLAPFCPLEFGIQRPPRGATSPVSRLSRSTES